jgi:hypothetical protein
MYRKATTLLASAIVLLVSVTASDALSIKSDGSVEIAGRRAYCAQAKIVRFDNGIPTEGMASDWPGTIYLNYKRLKGLDPLVQLFVFNHECAHLNLRFGGTESQADCWAVKRGLQEKWLTKSVIDGLCTLHHDHSICGNLRQCFSYYSHDSKAISYVSALYGSLALIAVVALASLFGMFRPRRV